MLSGLTNLEIIIENEMKKMNDINEEVNTAKRIKENELTNVY